MRIGRDYLGAPYYRKVVLKSHVHGYGGGVFWETFNHGKNTGKACVTEWAKQGAIFMPFIRVQGLWAGSSHNYNGQAKKALKIGEELNKIADSQPDIDFYYSPYCEANSVDIELLKKLRQEFRHLIIVHTANKGAPQAPGFLGETHGDYRPSWAKAFSYDGLSCINANSEEFKEGIEDLEYFMYWTSADNGRRNDSVKPPPPAIPNRVHYTSVKLNESVFYQALNTRTECTLELKNLGKSHADPDTPPNPKEDNKLVILSPVRGAKCELLDSNNKVIASAPHVGVSHEDGRNIYRFAKWGYEIAKKSRNLMVRIKRQKLGTIDPGFRVNEYRNKPG